MSTDLSDEDTYIIFTPLHEADDQYEMIHETERLRLSRLLKMTTELLPPDADILDALDDSSDALVFIDEPVDLPDSINLSDEIFDQKLLTLMQVVHNSLVPQLVATPFIYLGSSWKLISHSKFRAKCRKNLENMIDQLKTKKEVDHIKLLDDFHNILQEVFQVRLPAMLDYYASDVTYQRVSAQKVSNEMCSRLMASKTKEPRERVGELADILSTWYTYCPMGRPHVYLSDDHWALVSERELRKYYRQQIASQLFS